MGCYFSKDQKKVVFEDKRTHKKNEIKIQRRLQPNKSNVEDEQDKEISNILSPVDTKITNRNPEDILQDIVKLSYKCIDSYNEHDIDTSYELLQKIQSDIKQLTQRGYEVEMNKHFKEEFIQNSHLITRQYHEMLQFNKQILRDGWKLQKDKKNFKVYSRIEGQTVGIKLQTILNVPFEYFISIMVQPDHYKKFLPFITNSKELKKVKRNCLLGSVQMSFPIISNREAYFQGVAYNRLNNPKPQDQQLFMFTRSIHNRKDLQQQFGYQIQINQKYVQLDYKYLVVKYVPLSQNSGQIVMGMNIDLKLNMLPLKILQMVSISFSHDFNDNIVRISQNYEGSVWDQGSKKDPELFNFTKKVKNDYLQKIKK